MVLKDGANCPICDSRMDMVSKEIEYEYKGRTCKIVSLPVFTCRECGESFQNPKERRISEKLLTDFRRRTDELLESAAIRKIREQFGLSQIAFAKLLKVGEKNFARYESGQATQGRSLDNLLRVLKEYPTAIEILGGETQSNEGSLAFHKTGKIIKVIKPTQTRGDYVIRNTCELEKGVGLPLREEAIG